MDLAGICEALSTIRLASLPPSCSEAKGCANLREISDPVEGAQNYQEAVSIMRQREGARALLQLPLVGTRSRLT